MSNGHNLVDYETEREAFSWDDIYAEADWDAPEKLNIAHEVVDRHATDRERVALYQVDTDGELTKMTFWELADRSSQFANVLDRLGVEQGDRVFSYMPRIPEHYVALIGTLKHGAVWGSVNERFGPDGIAYRLDDCDAKVVVTTTDNRETVADALDDAPAVEHVITVDRGGGAPVEDVVFNTALDGASKEYEAAETGGEDNALLYYTSGTTGLAKGVLHKQRWVAGVAATQKYAVDLQPGDLYWSTGDLGWLTGAINTLGAWFWGTSLFTYEGEFDPTEWADLLDEFPVTVLFSVPTAYRMLREKEDVLDDVDLDLRHALSIGEPLSAGVVEWGKENLGVTILDTYGQTETGNMIINNYPTMELRPGSMGKPLPGIEADIVDPDTGEVLPPGETGEIAERGDYPCFFAEYWNKPEKTAACFVEGDSGEWYLSGDLAYKDEDGYFWFEGRADDVILSSGYRIGPFEVESSLGEHEAVAESAVVPKPHPERGNIVKAYVVLSEGTEPSESLKEDIKNKVKSDLSAHEYPREIEFRDELPKTVTGKIRRTELQDEAENETETSS
ncbi:acyl-CoA synthetase/AMP-acid ligase [Halogeometricum borinquense DSM 11551]|uniref:Acyl-CoA synthetase/AMP-acid ligase n=2 Tax=Halogeometricum borinquense TaxID=60847 RepID=E4NUM7_HALBP|nr:AMP-binding protein [Halogeometricum borinquense]ADQ68747.1 acyl-CoA synthetase/AMP-acid ligase [Halogeometricum borinquense DSM 11551]ELY25487.1 acyl-CoA synthetase/AMP-acid ligase [Halogeometricum borinquense DSM 11551]RYJ08446.1 acyl-CoA synthetase [Halogeometricum borinquense]